MLGRPKKQPDSILEEQLRLEEKKHPRWRDGASCRALPFTVSDSLFFDVDTNDPLKEVRRTFCRACPVQRICRLYGDVKQPDYGAYGGYTAQERRVEIRYRGTEPPAEAINAE